MDLIIDSSRHQHQAGILVTDAPKGASRCHGTVQMADGEIVREVSHVEMAPAAVAG